MAGYKNFNFMFIILDRYISHITLYEAAALSNFRAMVPFTDKGTIFFRPITFPNNPLAFSNSANYSDWSNHFFADDFPVKNPICFVIYEAFYTPLKSIKFFQHVRKNYPGCKLVLWVDNPIHTSQEFNKIFLDEAGTKEILSTFDCVLTYNQKDAIDYGLTYFEGPYSVIPFKQPKQNVDIFFVGQAKDRLEKILRAYETFTAAGFTCDFYVANVNNSPPPIHSVNIKFNKGLSYAETLEHVLRSHLHVGNLRHNHALLGVAGVQQNFHHGLRLLSTRTFRLAETFFN